MKLKQQEKVEGSAVVFFVFFFIESREEKGGARDVFVVC